MYVFYKQENHLTKYLHDIQDVAVIETQYGLVVKTASSSFRLDSNNPISSCVILGNCLTSLYLFSHSYIYISSTCLIEVLWESKNVLTTVEHTACAHWIILNLVLCLRKISEWRPSLSCPTRCLNWWWQSPSKEKKGEKQTGAWQTIVSRSKLKVNWNVRTLYLRKESIT